MEPVWQCFAPSAERSSSTRISTVTLAGLLLSMSTATAPQPRQSPLAKPVPTLKWRLGQSTLKNTTRAAFCPSVTPSVEEETAQLFRVNRSRSALVSNELTSRPLVTWATAGIPQGIASSRSNPVAFISAPTLPATQHAVNDSCGVNLEVGGS